MGSDSKVENYDPEIVVLYCAQSVTGVFSAAQTAGFNARLVAMPCSSKVEARHVLKILSEGADGVEVVACPDKKCRLLVGNNRAEKRIEYVRRILDEIGMGAQRAGIGRGEKLTLDGLIKIAKKRADTVKGLGPNPMKGEK